MVPEVTEITRNFTIVDGAFLLVLLLSCLIGLMRGFTREVLGIINWVGAIFVTLYGFPLLSPHVRHYITNPFIADASLYIVLFIVSIVVLSAVSRAISGHVKSSALGGIDRSLGLIFGLTRTFILMAIVYGGVLYLWPHDMPKPLKEAHSYPLFKNAFIISARFLPTDTLERLFSQSKQGDGASLIAPPSLGKTLDKIDLVNKLSNLRVLEPTSTDQQTPEYREEYNAELNRLILNHGKKPVTE